MECAQTRWLEIKFCSLVLIHFFVLKVIHGRILFLVLSIYISVRKINSLAFPLGLTKLSKADCSVKIDSQYALLLKDISLYLCFGCQTVLHFKPVDHISS